MPYLIKRAQTGPNGYVQFTFDQPVKYYLLGITSLSMTFGNEDHWISRISLKITTVAPPQPNIVAAEVKMVLQDASGNEISADSSVSVGCIASTESLILRSLPGIKDGESVPLAYACQPILSGFDLEVTDTRVQTMRFGATYEPPLEPIIGVEPPGHGEVEGFSELGTGKTVAGGTVDCGFMPLDDPKLQVKRADKIQQSSDERGAFYFDTSVVDGIVFVQDFFVAFAEPHNVKAIGVFVGQDPEAYMLRYWAAHAYVADTSGHIQTADSYVSLLGVGVVGLPVS